MKIGFGGGCHWCTEAVFQHLKGVEKVEQGWIASKGEANTFSEAVIVHYNEDIIPLKILIKVHLHTHKSTSNHSMRKKYRSGIYVFSSKEQSLINGILKELQLDFEDTIITEVLPFQAFKASRAQIQDYYKKNPNKPFCKTFINPKLKILFKKFTNYTDEKKTAHLKTMKL